MYFQNPSKKERYQEVIEKCKKAITLKNNYTFDELKQLYGKIFSTSEFGSVIRMLRKDFDIVHKDKIIIFYPKIMGKKIKERLGWLRVMTPVYIECPPDHPFLKGYKTTPCDSFSVLVEGVIN